MGNRGGSSKELMIGGMVGDWAGEVAGWERWRGWRCDDSEV